jgi:glyoxylase-like metal-dependent hydrolase (beta-lactamase superfamily II)
MHDDLIVIRLRLGPFWNFSYIVGSRGSGEAVVIDPAWDVPAIVGRAAEAGLRIRAAVVTHAHTDHAHGLAALVEATRAAALVHAKDAPLLEAIYDGRFQPVAHEAEVDLGRLCARVLHTPGHTPGSVCVLAGDALFTGDTLMVGAIGRPGIESDDAEMARALRAALASLPDTTRVFPGHDYGPHPDSTLARERALNPALGPARLDGR